MPRYRYKARTMQGKAVEAEMEALDDMALEAELSGQGLVLLSVAPVGTRGKQKAGRRGLALNNKELTLFTMELSTSYKAGLPLLSTLEDMAASSEAARIRGICAGVADRIRGGSSLLEALSAYPNAFPTLYVELVGAAERTGQLELVLDDLVRFLEWQKEVKGQIASATIYPASLFGAILLLLVVLMGFVFPKFLEQFSSMGAELPLPTVVAIAISDFLQNQWYVLIGGLATVFGVYMAVRNHPPVRWRIDEFKLKVPLIGPLLTKILMSRFTHNLSMMLASGLEFGQSLAICERLMGNAVLGKLVADAKTAIEQGMSLSDAMSRGGYIPSLVRRMLKLGESTGKMEETLEHVSHYYDKEVPESIKRMFAVMEPMLLAIMAGVVGFLVAAVFLPIYGMLDHIG